MYAEIQASFVRVLLVAGLIVVMSSTEVPGQGTPQNSGISPRQARLVENYGKLPLSFQANTGQAPRNVKFLSRGSGYGLFLTGQDAVLALHNNGCARKSLTETDNKAPAPERATSHLIDVGASCQNDETLVRMRLFGASKPSRYPTGEEQLAGTANYFIGNDPRNWRTNVPTYAKVRYRGVYSGVDLVYYGNQRQLEYDFVIAPGADPKPILLQLSGARALSLGPDGDLRVAAGNSSLTFRKPTIYQVINGQRKTVEGGYRLLPKSMVGFRLGSYDREKPLVIDPVLVYSTYLGGSGIFDKGDGANAVTVDTAGNVYVTGYTYSADFPVTTGAFQSKSNGAPSQNTPNNAFVTKLNPTATALVYSSYLGGSGAANGDTANAIAIDSSGNAYVAGQAYSTDFPVTPGAFQTVNHAAASAGQASNGFITKLNPTGSQLVYSTYLGGSQNEGGETEGVNGLAVDSSGNVYVAGTTGSSDFPVTQGAFQTVYPPAASDAFVTKLNATGNALIYSTFLGGNSVTFGMAIALDSSNNAYVTGSSFSTNFPVTPGAYQPTNHFSAYQTPDAFVTKLNSTGSALVFSTYLGGSGGPAGGDSGNAIVVDSTGNVYVAGLSSSSNFPVTPGAFQTVEPAAGVYNGTGHNAFVTKLNPTGTVLIYSTYLGGGGLGDSGGGEYSGDSAYGLSVDAAGSAYVVGTTESFNFPVTTAAISTTLSSTLGSAFITKLNPAGTALVFSTYLNSNSATAVALDSTDNIYVVGSADSGNLPVTSGVFQAVDNAAANHGSNAYITKLDLSLTTTSPIVTVTPASSTITTAETLAVTASVGATTGNPTPTGSVTLTSGSYTSTTTTLGGGTAIINIPAGSLATGSDTLTVTYLPDSASSSIYNSAVGVSSVEVNATSVLTTLTLSANPTSSAYGQQVSLSATLSPFSAQSNTTNGESVTFYNGNGSLGTGSLSSGVATFNVTTLPVGTDSIKAVYAGDTTFLASTSNTLSFAVSLAAPTITFTLPNQTYGVPPFAVNATSNSSGAITYSVVSGPATISGSTVTLTGTGTVTLKASQVAAGNYLSGTQNAVFVVAPIATSGWAWIAGSSSMIYLTTNVDQWGQPGMYGTLDTAAPGNTPGGREGPSSWTDSSGHFWIFGGDGFDSSGDVGWLNDLWEFNPSTDQWAWMGGSSTHNPHGVYGTLGVSAAANIPGGRWRSTTWKDSSGNVWLFGGYGDDVNGSPGYFNDLWEFNAATNQWTWKSGSSAVGNYAGELGVYGTLGTAAPGNVPGGRESASGWIDGSGNLWLFGGFGSDVNGDMNDFNDLWEFNPSTSEWTWMGGSNALGSNCFAYAGETICGQSGVYGTLGLSVAGNIPGGRVGATTWSDSIGNLWLFGGNGFDSTVNNGLLNDLWQFNYSTRQWAWMGGSSTIPTRGSVPGVYGTLGAPASTNVPGGRFTASGWSDGSGNLWLFGGDGFDSKGQQGQLNDLWEFTPSTNQWAWMSGGNTVSCASTNFGNQCGMPGVYFTVGDTTVGATPGGRDFATAWTDGSGSFWVFSGNGYDANSNWGSLNDLWRYQPPTGTNPSKITPAVTVTPSPSTITTAQPLTVTVAVSGGSGKPTATGSVTLMSGTYTSASNTLSSGSATISVPAGSLATGADTLTVTYTPDASSSSTYNSATGTGSVTVTAIAKTTPTVIVTPAASSITTAQPLSVTIAVNGGSGNPIPTGSVSLTGGGYTSPATTLSGGDATINIPAGSLATGSDTLTVTYAPDSASSTTYNGASGAASVTVTAVSNTEYDWTWMSGSNTFDAQGVYGSLGTPADANVPGNRSSAVSWTDKNGNLWLFGGYQINSNGVYGYLNDIWEFSPSTSQWAWMGGSSSASQPGVYGTLGTAAAGNVPGSRASAASWIDSNGKLWLLGGMGEDANGIWGWLNDLWLFNPSTNLWTWMGGNNTVGTGCDQSGDCGRPGVYGTLETPASANIPGGRYGANTWIDGSGHVWLFGGNGFDAGGKWGLLNDLWEFNPSTSEWTWMSGSNSVGTSTGPIDGQPGVYGTLGTAAAGNIPGGRRGASSWIDNQGNLWLLEGEGTDANGNYANQHDLWEYIPSSNEWAWMGGTTYGNAYGVFGTLGTPAIGNFPGSRSNATNWTDSSGNFWLFGGTGLLSNATSFGGRLNDLWEYSVSTNEWAWMGGSNAFPSNCAVPGSCGQSGLYGTLGIPAADNIPGSRFEANGWMDNFGNFWLFGGLGFDAAGNDGTLNDLWMYQPSTVVPAAATPIFSVPTGTYTSAQSVTISDTTPGATIYYTTDGTTPSTSSSVYSSAITVSSSETLEAIATASGYSKSAVATAAYTISPVVSGPKIQSVSAILPQQTQTITITGSGFGTHAAYVGDSTYISIKELDGVTWQAGYANSGQGIDDLVTLSITSWTDSQIVLAGFTGSYGSNGWVLSQGDNLYLSVWNPQTGAGPFNCANIFVGAGPTTCGAISAAATPAFSVPAGTYKSAQSVTISDTTPGATIYYTTDGTTPTSNSSVYSSAITVSSSETLEAIAAANGYSTSAVATAAYVISPQVAPGFTVSGTAVSVSPGSTTGNISTITVTPSGGFTGSVALTATISSSPAGAQYSPTLSFGSTTPVSITGPGAGTATLTISTTAATSAFLVQPKHDSVPWYATGCATLACMLLVGIRAERRRIRGILGMLALLIALTGGVLACGGGGGGNGGGGGGSGHSGTTAGTYIVTVTGTSGSTTTTGAVTLTVQ